LTSPSVVIIGAGIAGLAAAYELLQCGVTPIVLEASDRAGGLILTDREGPFVIDAGPDSILATKRGGTALCEALGLGDRLISTTPPRTSSVLAGGRLHPLPRPAVLGLPLTWRAAAGATMISPAGRARMTLEPWIPARVTPDESIASFIGRRFGRQAVEYLAEPLLAGIHAGDIDRLAVRPLFPALVDAERTHGSVMKGLRERSTEAVSQPASEPREGLFLSLPGGMGELVQTLEAALPGGTIQLRARVAAVRQEEGQFRVYRHEGRVSCAAVIVAAPAWAAQEMLEALDPMLATLCGGIPYTSSAIVTLAFDLDAVGAPLTGSGFVVPRAEREPIMAATWVSSKWPGRAPPDTVLIRAFLGGARDPDAVNRSDADLVDAALRTLTPIARLSGVPRLARVYRWRRASPQLEIGHLARLAAIEQRLNAWPGLFLTGSGYRVTGIPDGIEDARATARKAAKFVNAQRQP
jgi:protoporphyrinogen/coproporphyrinogen III oxidase